MRHNKGFTLVELLAVVVILGIIITISIPAVSKWIEKSKMESKESQKNTLVMATESYAQANQKVLPKGIGQKTKVSAEDLKNAKYLKEDLVDADKNSCMNSYVEIYKYDKSKYKYTPYLQCDGDIASDAGTATEPIITVSFLGDKKADSFIHDVSISSFKIVISGGQKGAELLGIEGYSYSISARYSNTTDDHIVEIYSSGSLSGARNKNIVIEKSLSEYTDVTKVNEFLITVDAINEEGGHKTVTASSTYKDTDAPICGVISGEPAANSWLKKRGDKRTITVACSDGEGSGCVKDTFTKTFDEEMEFGYIPITDNAGNITQCKVRVNIDWTAPSLTINAYKRTSNGGKGSFAGAAAYASHSTLHNTITINTYSNSVNGWLNKSNYPYGVYYEIMVDDNVTLYTGVWSYNSSGIYNANANSINSYSNSTTDTFTNESKTSNVYLSGEGMRRAKYTVSDKAGNKVEIYINANIDKTNPECHESSRGNVGSTGGVSITLSCSDGESKCSSSNTLYYQGQKSSTTYTVQDNAGNSSSCGVAITSYNCQPYECNCQTCGGGTGGNCTYRVVKAMCSGKGRIETDPDLGNYMGCGIGSYWLCYFYSYKCNCQTCYHTCYR